MSDIDPVNVANPQNTGVHVFHGDYGNTNWSGWAPCQELNNDQKCKRSNVFANQYHGPYSQDQRESLLCHEFGHTAGLLGKDHSGDGSCVEHNTGHWHRDYDSHDRGHLNENYAP